VTLTLLVWGLMGATHGCGRDSPGAGDSDAAVEADAAADAAPQGDAAPGEDAAPGQDAAPVDAGLDPDGALPDGALPDGALLDGSLPDGALPDAGGGDLALSLGTIQMWANCMPMVPPDPWHLEFDVTYDNNAGATAATAVVTSVKVLFSGGSNPSLDMTVTPTVVGPVAAGASTTVTHTKTASSPDLPNDCGLCGSQATLEVRVDLGGTEVLLTSSPFQPMCAY
jgi:hypothetical protein